MKSPLFYLHTTVSLSVGAGQRTVTNPKILFPAMPLRIYDNPQTLSRKLFIYKRSICSSHV